MVPPRPPDDGNGFLLSYAESNSSFEILSYEASLHREESPCLSHYGDERGLDCSRRRSRCTSPFPMFFPYDASESREKDHMLCSRKPSSGFFCDTDKHCKQKALGSSYHQGTVMNTGTKPPPYSDHPAERLFYEFFFDSSSILYDVHISNEDLGTGSYGRVQVATYSQIKVAVKSFHVILQGSHRHIQKFKDECKMLNTIKHPNVVQFLGVHMDSRTHRPYLVMELMEGGSLYELIDNVRDDFQRLSFSRRLNIITDVASAIAFLHNPHNLVHRDLSSKNVLLTRELRAKISDFGMARPFTSSLHNQPQTKAPGCTPYMPPEALRDNTTFTEKGDVFSLGVIMIQVVTGCYPNPSSSTREVNENTLIRVSELERRARDLHLFSRQIKRAKSPQHLCILVNKIIRDNPTDRPNADYVVHALTHIVSLQHEEKYDMMPMTTNTQYTAQPMTTRALSCELLCTQMQDDNRTPQPEDSGSNPGNSTELVITTRCISEFSPNAGVEAEHTSRSPQATICESTCSQEENQPSKQESQSSKQESQSSKKESQNGIEESQSGKQESQSGKQESQSGKQESQSSKQESQSGKEESQYDEEESQSGKKESQNGIEESQSGKQESQSGKQESQSGKEKSQSGKKESQNGIEESQSGKQESQSGKEESQYDEEESQSGKKESQNGIEESQSGKQESQSSKQESQSGKEESQYDEEESQSGKKESQNGIEESQSGKRESQSGKRESQSGKEKSQSGKKESQNGKKESQNGKEESHSGQSLHRISFVLKTMAQIAEPHTCTTPPMQETDSEESNQLLLAKDEALLKTEKPSENTIATSEEMQPMEASEHEPFHEKETVSGICCLEQDSKNNPLDTTHAVGEHVYSYVQQAADECHQELLHMENEVDENLFTISKESVDQGDSKTQLVGISQPIFCQQANTSVVCLSSVNFTLTRLDENIDAAESVSTECPRSPSVLKPISKQYTTALVPSKDFDHERASSHSCSPTFNPLSLISPHRDIPLILFFQNMVSHLYRSLRYEVAIKTIFEPQCELSQNYSQPRFKSLKFFCEEFSQHSFSLSKFFSQSAPPLLLSMSLNFRFIDKKFLQSRTPATEQTPSALLGSGPFYANLCANGPGQEKLSALEISAKHSCKSRARNEHLYEIVTHARRRYNEQILSTLHLPSVSISAIREYLLPIVANSCLVYLSNLLYHTNSTLHKQSCIVSTICLSAKSLCSPLYQTNRCNNPYSVHCFFKLKSSFSSTSSLYQDLKRNGCRLFQRHGQPPKGLFFPCYSSQTHSNSLSLYSESISVDHECQSFEILFTYGNYSKCIHMVATDYQIITSVKMHSTHDLGCIPVGDHITPLKHTHSPRSRDFHHPCIGEYVPSNTRIKASRDAAVTSHTLQARRQLFGGNYWSVHVMPLLSNLDETSVAAHSALCFKMCPNQISRQGDHRLLTSRLSVKTEILPTPRHNQNLKQFYDDVSVSTHVAVANHLVCLPNISWKWPKHLVRPPIPVLQLLPNQKIIPKLHQPDLKIPRSLSSPHSHNQSESQKCGKGNGQSSYGSGGVPPSGGGGGGSDSSGPPSSSGNGRRDDNDRNGDKRGQNKKSGDRDQNVEEEEKKEEKEKTKKQTRRDEENSKGAPNSKSIATTVNSSVRKKGIIPFTSPVSTAVDSASLEDTVQEPMPEHQMHNGNSRVKDQDITSAKDGQTHASEEQQKKTEGVQKQAYLMERRAAKSERMYELETCESRQTVNLIHPPSQDKLETTKPQDKVHQQSEMVIYKEIVDHQTVDLSLKKAAGDSCTSEIRPCEASSISPHVSSSSQYPWSAHDYQTLTPNKNHLGESQPALCSETPYQKGVEEKGECSIRQREPSYRLDQLRTRRRKRKRRLKHRERRKWASNLRLLLRSPTIITFLKHTLLGSAQLVDILPGIEMMPPAVLPQQSTSYISEKSQMVTDSVLETAVPNKKERCVFPLHPLRNMSRRYLRRSSERQMQSQPNNESNYLFQGLTFDRVPVQESQTQQANDNYVYHSMSVVATTAPSPRWGAEPPIAIILRRQLSNATVMQCIPFSASRFMPQNSTTSLACSSLRSRAYMVCTQVSVSVLMQYTQASHTMHVQLFQASANISVQYQRTIALFECSKVFAIITLIRNMQRLTLTAGSSSSSRERKCTNPIALSSTIAAALNARVSPTPYTRILCTTLELTECSSTVNMNRQLPQTSLAAPQVSVDKQCTQTVQSKSRKQKQRRKQRGSKNVEQSKQKRDQKRTSEWRGEWLNVRKTGKKGKWQKVRKREQREEKQKLRKREQREERQKLRKREQRGEWQKGRKKERSNTRSELNKVRCSVTVRQGLAHCIQNVTVPYVPASTSAFELRLQASITAEMQLILAKSFNIQHSRTSTTVHKFHRTTSLQAPLQQSFQVHSAVVHMQLPHGSIAMHVWSNQVHTSTHVCAASLAVRVQQCHEAVAIALTTPATTVLIHVLASVTEPIQFLWAIGAMLTNVEYLQAFAINGLVQDPLTPVPSAVPSAAPFPSTEIRRCTGARVTYSHEESRQQMHNVSYGVVVLSEKLHTQLIDVVMYNYTHLLLYCPFVLQDAIFVYITMHSSGFCCARGSAPSPRRSLVDYVCVYD